MSKNYITLSLGRSSSTICREVNRNTVKGQAYRAVKAQGRANKLRYLARKSQKMDINIPMRHYVLFQLGQLWSPEQIAKRLKILYPENMDMQISHENIYSYLYVLPRGALRKELVKCLRRRRHINRRIRGKSRQKSCPIQDYISIEERPAEVADRDHGIDTSYSVLPSLLFPAVRFAFVTPVLLAWQMFPLQATYSVSPFAKS